jgi:cytochrome c-type biogenesis protein CcmE
MKTSHILLLLLLIAAIGIVISLVFKADTYSSFREARISPGREVQIIGTPERDSTMKTDTLDGLHFTFYMRDDKDELAKVRVAGGEPRDFKKLEQVVVIGKMEDSVFMASSLLLKCPSKYDEDNAPEEFGEKKFGQ